MLDRLRSRLDKVGRTDLPLIFPPPSLCTGVSTVAELQFASELEIASTDPRSSGSDNAAMIAFVGLSRLERGLVDPLTVMQRAKWPINECEADFGAE